MSQKKKVFIRLVLFLVLFFSLTTVGNANTIKVEQSKTASGGVNITVSSDVKVKELRMYLKSSGKWNLFYVNTESGYTSKKFFISKSKISMSEDSNIKVIVIDENGDEATNVAIINQNPAPSVSPSTSPSTTPSTKPSTSPSASTSTKPSTSTSTSPSTKPSISATTTPSTSTTTKPSTSTSPSTSPSTSTKPSQPATVKSIKLNKTSATIVIGNTLQLVKTITPSNATTKLTWSSNNSKVATVDGNGKVKAIAKGTATITVKTANGKKATCQVKVIEKPAYTTKLNGHTVKLPAGDDRVYIIDTQDLNAKNNRYSTSDAIIIESNGKFAMIDTGLKRTSKRVTRYLKDLGVKELEFVLITHAHIDHCGGFEYLANSSGINIKALYIKNISKSNSNRMVNYNNAVKVAKQKNIKIYNVSNSKYQTLKCGEFTFKLYNTPDRLIKAGKDNKENVNSVTALTKIHGKKLYFAADIVNDGYVNCNAENIAAKAVGKIDFYKVAHHLYSPNNSVTAMKILNPSYAVATTQKGYDKSIAARDRVLNNSRVTDKTLRYTADGTVILTIGAEGNFSFSKLGKDGV